MPNFVRYLDDRLQEPKDLVIRTLILDRFVTNFKSLLKA